MKCKVGILGNGKLGGIIKDALENGLAPECEYIGSASRNLGVSAQDLVDRGAKIIIEASKPEVLKNELIPILKRGVGVIPLSAGVFCDQEFLEAAKNTAREYGSKIYLPHGAIGAFDLAATFDLIPGMKSTLVQYIPERSELPEGNPMAALPELFKGTALEGFSLSPSHLNIVIETAIASGGFDKTFYETRIPEDGRGGFSLELENDSNTAVIRICSKPQKEIHPMSLIALSTVSLLNRITSPISF